ncbi:MAG: cold shock domain-containing protein [Prevotella sp.]|jgi:cold shock CspA family protein|nr:cold shock domain-containing protein [Prevotella sp.]MCI1282175.1 cold shock domain-containing protein [Prevotella sp.]
MANRISSNKKEREKIKQQKRLEKQKQKEERKSQGSSSFEDMIAYVDEYGRLSSTPPEEPAEVINVEDVQISTPKKVEEEIVRQTGKVDFFNPSKGFGFIKDGNGNKFFFHISNAPENIGEGDNVEFDSEENARGMDAVNITIVTK